VHPRPAPETVIEQSGACQSRQFKITVRARPGKPIEVVGFRIDQTAWGPSELLAWNRELAEIVNSPVITFQCTSRGDLVSIAGEAAPELRKANYVMITASGGRGRWFGYQRSTFIQRVELLAAEPTKRAQ
jgi:hypothetical protein